MVSIDDYLKPEFKAQLRAKFENSDLTAKCYITGELLINNLATNNWCLTAPEIRMMSVDDIIFE